MLRTPHYVQITQRNPLKPVTTIRFFLYHHLMMRQSVYQNKRGSTFLCVILYNIYIYICWRADKTLTGTWIKQRCLKCVVSLHHRSQFYTLLRIQWHGSRYLKLQKIQYLMRDIFKLKRHTKLMKTLLKYANMKTVDYKKCIKQEFFSQPIDESTIVSPGPNYEGLKPTMATKFYITNVDLDVYF